MKKLFTSLQSCSVSRAADFWLILVLFLAGVLLGTCHFGRLAGSFAYAAEIGEVPAGGLPVFLFENLKFQASALLLSLFLFGFLLVPCLSFLMAYVYAYAFRACFLSASSFSSCWIYLLLFLLSAPVTLFLFAEFQRISIQVCRSAFGRSPGVRLSGRDFVWPAFLLLILSFLDTAAYLILKVWR